MRSHRKNELLKHYLKDASSFLDMVDGYFLEPAILHRDRTATEWAYWLGGADRAFEDAKALRKHVEKLIEKFGPDVTMARS